MENPDALEDFETSFKQANLHIGRLHQCHLISHDEYYTIIRILEDAQARKYILWHKDTDI